MPKISVNPSASNAYCAPRLMPMMPASRNTCTRLQFRLDADHSDFLAILDDTDAEREHKFLRDTELLLARPHALAHVRIVHRQMPQCLGYFLHVVHGAGGLNGLQRHARARKIAPHRG